MTQELSKERFEQLNKLSYDCLLSCIKYSSRKEEVKELIEVLYALPQEVLSLGARQTLLAAFQDYYYNLGNDKKYEDWILNSRKLNGIDDYIKNLESFDFVDGHHFKNRKNIFKKLSYNKDEQYYNNYNEEELKSFKTFLKSAILDFVLLNKHKNFIITGKEYSPQQIELSINIFNKISTLIPFFDFFTHEIQLSKHTKTKDKIIFCKEFKEQSIIIEYDNSKPFDFRTSLQLYKQVVNKFDEYLKSKFNMERFSEDNLEKFAYMLSLLKNNVEDFEDNFEDYTNDLYTYVNLIKNNIINFFRWGYLPELISKQENNEYLVNYKDFVVIFSNLETCKLIINKNDVQVQTLIFLDDLSEESFLESLNKLKLDI